MQYNKSPNSSTDNSSTGPTSNTATAPETSKPTTAVALETVPIVFDSVTDGFPSMISQYLYIHYIMQHNIEYIIQILYLKLVAFYLIKLNIPTHNHSMIHFNHTNVIFPLIHH